MSVLEKILKEIEKVANEHPYKVPGKPETYGSYNEAWQDCSDRISGIITGMMEDEMGSDNDGMISINDERLWQILSEEACVEGQQAERIHQRIKEICGDGWIPVHQEMDDKDLPNDGEIVLVSFENFGFTGTARYEKDEDGGAFFMEETDSTYAEYGMFVNAWQPLPESYNPKEEDDV